jgi:hypothetical protein
MTVVIHPPYSPELTPCDFSLASRLNIKVEGCCFDTTEVIVSGSQAVL